MNINEWAAEQAAGRKITGVSNGSISAAVKRVETMRGVQRHRGFKGYVYVAFAGERKPEMFRTGFHQKAKTARAAAEQIARAFRRIHQ